MKAGNKSPLESDHEMDFDLRDPEEAMDEDTPKSPSQTLSGNEKQQVSKSLM